MPEQRNAKARKTHAARRIDVHIGARLRRKRLQSRIPSAFLAKYLGIGRDELAAYESGTKELMSSHIHALSGLFSVSPDYFFAGLDDGNRSTRATPNRMRELTMEIVEEVAAPTYRHSSRKSGDYSH